jgi:hypothetical protein
MRVFSKFGRKRILYKLKNSAKLSEDTRKPDEVQRQVLSIFIKALSFQETELLQEQSMLYVHWSHITIKLSVSEDRVVVMNGKYYYYLSLSKPIAERMRLLFYRKLNKRLGKIENHFNNSVVKNLGQILTEMGQ